jgi:hypothetical protein
VDLVRLLPLASERRKSEAESENDREPDHLGAIIHNYCSDALSLEYQNAEYDED